MKKVYKRPNIKVFEVILENSIVVASAFTKPQSFDSVEAEWELDADEDKSFIWQ